MKLHGWMVYKAILREMQQELGAGFPADVPSNSSLSTASDVAKLLRESAYWKEHAAALKLWAEPTKLDDRIREWHQKLQSDLQGDAWMQTFSGKEIFRHLRSHVRGLDEAPTRPPNPNAAERDLNLGKRIARKMNEMNRVPAKLAEIRRILRAKAGL